jgi:hypothetical protein
LRIASLRHASTFALSAPAGFDFRFFDRPVAGSAAPDGGNEISLESVASMALLRALCVLLAAPSALSIRPGQPDDSGLTRRSTLDSASVEAEAARKLLLFGLTARDKAAHNEHRDAMIEARGAHRPGGAASLAKAACHARAAPSGLSPRVRASRPYRALLDRGIGTLPTGEARVL